MSDQKKKVSQNGAYHGPPNPPQQVCSSSPFCCVLCTLMKVMIAIGFGLGIAALIFWVIIRPTKVKFYVVTADLIQFDLTNSTTLNYNLSLNMEVRNPNSKIGIYYDKLVASASYQGKKFSWVTLPSFYQDNKNTTTLRQMFCGHSVIVLGGNDLSCFNEEKNTGFFYVDVKLYAQIRFKIGSIGSIKTRRFKSDIECNLRIPLDSNDTMAGGFESTRCDVDF